MLTEFAKTAISIDYTVRAIGVVVVVIAGLLLWLYSIDQRRNGR